VCVVCDVSNAFGFSQSVLLYVFLLAVSFASWLTGVPIAQSIGVSWPDNNDIKDQINSLTGAQACAASTPVILVLCLGINITDIIHVRSSHVLFV